MSQYQSFPDAVGASKTLDKLRALRLPDLSGKNFLDVGCNEGFFCGFARFQGALKVVGLDYSAEFIRRARARFPDCEFLAQGWEILPEGPFDAILLASAIHYADDQPALINSLMDIVAPDGVLVLEMGVIASEKAEWVKVKRGIDERYFPSMGELERVLADYAWKWMGPSVPQDGDPIERHVIHVRHRRPVAYLLMQPPGFGKSSIAKEVFFTAGIEVISGDSLLSRVSRRQVAASSAFTALVVEGFSPFAIDETIDRLFKEGFCNEIASLWMSDAPPGDVAIDAYVPAEFHSNVSAALEALGYMPVTMHWTPVGAKPVPDGLLDKLCEAFYFSLVTHADGDGREYAPAGFVDEVRISSNSIVVRGWAVDERGSLPGNFLVRLGGEVYEVGEFEKQLRPDVQQYLGLPHSLLGFRLKIPNSTSSKSEKLQKDFSVTMPDGVALKLSSPLSEIAN